MLTGLKHRAYYLLYRGELWKSPLRSLNTLVHVFLMICGLFLLGPGLYAAVKVRPAFGLEEAH